MNIIENEGRILEAIDQLRRRKARPDADRICNYLLRRFNVDRSETVATLNRIILNNPAKVIKVTYKGSTSYRRPSTPKQVKSSKKYQQDFTVLLSSALSELIVQEPDYLDFGVPPDEFEKFIYEKEKPLYNKKSLKLIIQAEINKGTLVRLETGNLSLVDGNCSPSAIGLEESSNSMYVTGARVKLEPPDEVEEGLSDDQVSEQIDSEGENPETKLGIKKEKEEMPVERAKRGRKKKTGLAAEKFAKVNTGRMQTHGFRDGARRKRAAKKVFDPSDNHQPSKRRGRPLGSKNKEPPAQPSPPIISKDRDKVEQVFSETCCVCHRQKSPTNEKLLACRDCTNKAHPSCSQRKGVGYDETWQCAHCKTCCVCSETDEYASMVICFVCDDAYHFSCHTPQIPHKIKNTFVCRKCAAECLSRGPTAVPLKAKREMLDEFISSADSSSNSHTSSPRNSPLLELSPSPAPDLPLPAITATNSTSGVSTGTSSGMSSGGGSTEENMDWTDADESIPDSSSWSVLQVSRYLRDQGYPDQAKVFKLNEIDGAALLLLKRSDVVGSSMFDKLGPALKAYRQVRRLQLRRGENHLLWAM